MKHLVPFCGSPDPTVALRASCVMGLAIQGFLASLARSDPQDTDVRTFPGYLLPLYYTIQSWKTSDVSRWSYVSIIPASTIHPPPSDQEMWSDLLYDAPLINLAVLANAVLSRSSAQEVHLTMPWKTLEALLKAFDIVQVRASPETQSRFHDVHGRVRSSINRHEGGRIIVPLLDTLDIVARGLRLSEVFASVPGTRLLRSQVEILFGRDQLRNHDLLEAFVSHLPGYIASTPPDVSRALMERIVNEDQLWEKLHVNLSKCFLPTIPFSEKMRIVKMFHDLLDELFVLLEGSPNIDWHAPEFDLLIGHLSRYDREVARGMLVDRSLVFRDDFFTAQFCHASLAQFAVLASRGDPLTMYSIGSLIRIFVDLEAGEEEEVRFWGSRRSQGVNGPELRMKAEKMVISLLRNGPLSNFYRLGMLSFDMVQDETGDSVSENVKKTWKLLEKIIDSTLMPMGGASPRLWFHFDHFRDTVRNAATVASARGVKHLLPLLEMVNRVDALPRAATDDVQSTDDSSEDGGKPPSSEWEDLPGDPRRRPDGPPRPAPYNRRMHPHKGRHRPPRGVRFDDGPMPPMMGYPPPGPGGPWDNSGPNPMEWSHGMPPGVPPDMPPMSGPPPHPPFPPPRRQSTSRFGSLDFVPPYTERFDGGHDRMYPVGPGGPAVGPHDYMNSMDPGGSGSNMPPMLPPPRPGPSHHPGNPFFPPRRRYSGFSESPPPLNRNRSSPAPAPAPAVDYTTPDAMYPNDGGGNDEWRAHQ
ncbi:hypothetical protein BC834DRAFT_971921 [Gloeopeniophorella convolvens]|nr:hypothetical protein BC834DRAFT_971921 [Gloeopeniophorella convolvens]